MSQHLPGRSLSSSSSHGSHPLRHHPKNTAVLANRASRDTLTLRTLRLQERRPPQPLRPRRPRSRALTRETHKRKASALAPRVAAHGHGPTLGRRRRTLMLAALLPSRRRRQRTWPRHARDLHSAARRMRRRPIGRRPSPSQSRRRRGGFPAFDRCLAKRVRTLAVGFRVRECMGSTCLSILQ